jgi:ribosomal protein S18 acetylase RimI-like enzyme
MDEEILTEHIFRPQPLSVYDVHWGTRLLLGAWRAGELIGFLDAAIGHDRDHLDLPDYEPDGLLRFLALTERADLMNDVFAALMEQAETFWRGERARQAVAFHISTGYPAFQAGAGILPAEWSDIQQLLTNNDWRFSERYYALTRSLGAPLEEEIPQADVSLVQQRTGSGRTYTLYHRRVEWIGRARMVGMTLDLAGAAERVAHLTELEVSEPWRNRNIGKWMLRRLLNDAALLGYQEMLVYLPARAAVAMNLFTQHGFRELAYRGYSFEKRLAP